MTCGRGVIAPVTGLMLLALVMQTAGLQGAPGKLSSPGGLAASQLLNAPDLLSEPTLLNAPDLLSEPTLLNAPDLLSEPTLLNNPEILDAPQVVDPQGIANTLDIVETLLAEQEPAVPSKENLASNTSITYYVVEGNSRRSNGSSISAARSESPASTTGPTTSHTTSPTTSPTTSTIALRGRGLWNYSMSTPPYNTSVSAISKKKSGFQRNLRQYQLADKPKLLSTILNKQSSLSTMLPEMVTNIDKSNVTQSTMQISSQKNEYKVVENTSSFIKKLFTIKDSVSTKSTSFTVSPLNKEREKNTKSTQLMMISTEPSLTKEPSLPAVFENVTIFPKVPPTHKEAPLATLPRPTNIKKTSKFSSKEKLQLTTEKNKLAEEKYFSKSTLVPTFEELIFLATPPVKETKMSVPVLSTQANLVQFTKIREHSQRSSSHSVYLSDYSIQSSISTNHVSPTVTVSYREQKSNKTNQVNISVPLKATQKLTVSDNTRSTVVPTEADQILIQPTQILTRSSILDSNLARIRPTLRSSLSTEVLKQVTPLTVSTSITTDFSGQKSTRILKYLPKTNIEENIDFKMKPTELVSSSVLNVTELAPKFTETFSKSMPFTSTFLPSFHFTKSISTTKNPLKRAKISKMAIAPSTAPELEDKQEVQQIQKSEALGSLDNLTGIQQNTSDIHEKVKPYLTNRTNDINIALKQLRHGSTTPSLSRDETATISNKKPAPSSVKSRSGGGEAALQALAQLVLELGGIARP